MSGVPQQVQFLEAAGKRGEQMAEQASRAKSRELPINNAERANEARQGVAEKSKGYAQASYQISIGNGTGVASQALSNDPLKKYILGQG